MDCARDMYSVSSFISVCAHGEFRRSREFCLVYSGCRGLSSSESSLEEEESS